MLGDTSRRYGRASSFEIKNNGYKFLNPFSNLDEFYYNSINIIIVLIKYGGLIWTERIRI
jgi:hypothetical protein